MDLSKLDQNEQLAVYGAIASIVGPILSSIGFGFGVGWLTLILAVGMLAIVFLPQWSPQASLPGSKGSLMLVVGGIAAVSATLALLGSIGYLGFFGADFLSVVGWLIGIAGGLLMGWAGWQVFQAEGGRFQLGNTATTSSPPATAAPAPQPVTPARPEPLAVDPVEPAADRDPDA
jgi:hypothetical protein